jgi:hypothetical protein
MRSRMVICGDPNQVDLPDSGRSGIADVVSRLEGIRSIATVRFTSATGEETENPAQAVQTADPLLSIMIRDGVPIHLPVKPAHSIVFQRSPSLDSRGCRTACERPMPIALMPDCSPP